MERHQKLTPALKKAQEVGIDLTLLYERLSWTPTKRIEKHLRMLEFANELRKAGQKIVANLKVENLIKELRRLEVDLSLSAGWPLSSRARHT